MSAQRRLRTLAVGVAATGCPVGGGRGFLRGGLRAQTADPTDVAAGMRIYRQKADCQSCHGWAADGRKMDTQMPDGANLRTTRLGRAGIIAAIKCGRPGRGMPAFDRFAYSDGRCNDMKQADLKRLGL